MSDQAIEGIVRGDIKKALRKTGAAYTPKTVEILLSIIDRERARAQQPIAILRDLTKTYGILRHLSPNNEFTAFCDGIYERARIAVAEDEGRLGGSE